MQDFYLHQFQPLKHRIDRYFASSLRVQPFLVGLDALRNFATKTSEPHSLQTKNHALFELHQPFYLDWHALLET